MITPRSPDEFITLTVGSAALAVPENPPKAPIIPTLASPPPMRKTSRRSIFEFLVILSPVRVAAYFFTLLRVTLVQQSHQTNAASSIAVIHFLNF
jgi:hypothetical protein